jgi:hypothetical protein
MQLPCKCHLAPISELMRAFELPNEMNLLSIVLGVLTQGTLK